MGTLFVGIGIVITMFMYAYGSRYRAAIRKITRNCREINIYGELEDSFIKNLIKTFNEKYPLSEKKVYEFSVEEIESYAKATEELLESIKKHVQKN